LTWGGIVSLAAKQRGVAGLVVDGEVRDLDEIRKFDFPVFSRYVVPTSGKERVKILSMNTVVKIDGIRVRAGDIIVGDGIGTVCVPIEAAEEVMIKVKRMSEQDKEAIREIRRGMTFTETLRNYAKI
jgi:3-hexulose-6-phosphate synthase/6-phospho-3-hexuloisomerase